MVVVVGRVRKDLSAPVREYEKRAARYWKLEVIEVAGGGPGRDTAPDAVRDAEADRILARIPSELEIVALTREGQGMDSRELAGYLEQHGVRSSPGVAFVVGGAFGLGRAVLERARKALSLSEMTLPHEMARLLLAEQLYRAGTILRGEPYHKG
ncbi:MAG: 23S rRNA (pseudouridine(1915)-N(3))-methyltransferase RlmH [Gemmatimonadetes bacterium]|nr:23S rRNA (pseudouridine(1915)-N(3))-methyltransferase RlmH [Gemmatimonadota bacterium]MDA1104359.1 23S rRNA (pseudouridine(1915)-N(3))-methyltransferase RlmH [Gemmatimonadota bacterium]